MSKTAVQAAEPTATDPGHALGQDESEQALTTLRQALARKTVTEAEITEYEWKQELASKHNARIYSFVGPVVVQTTQLCMDTIGQWTREDPIRPIRLVFNSPGGSVMDGLALYDYITQLRAETDVKFTTVALGTCASMAGILLQAGDQRIVGKHAYMMIHEISAEAIGTMSEVEDTAKFVRRLQERCLDILASKATIPKDEIKDKWERREWWLDADEALTAGFCDEVQ